MISRLLLPATVLVAACGVQLTGAALEESDAGPRDAGDVVTRRDADGVPERGPDGGADAAATDAGPDAKTPVVIPCGQLRGSDPTVRLCIDFDEQDSGTPPFGFKNVTNEPYQAMTVGPSSIPGAGNALTVALTAGSTGSRDAHGEFPSPVFSPAEGFTLDVDITVKTAGIDYALLAAFSVLGSSCGVHSGIGIDKTSIVHAKEGGVVALRPFTVGVPFHVRLASRPGVSVTRPETIAIDGTEYPPFNLDYGATCDKTQLRIGTFFTSTAAAAVAVEFDHVVLRWE